MALAEEPAIVPPVLNIRTFGREELRGDEYVMFRKVDAAVCLGVSIIPLRKAGAALTTVDAARRSDAAVDVSIVEDYLEKRC